MEELKWYHNRYFSNELERETTLFFHKFRKLFREECTPAFLIPNYVTFRHNPPSEDIGGVRCFRIMEHNDLDDFVFNVYPSICCKEITNAVAANMPSHVDTAVINVHPTDVARWVISAFFGFSVGVANYRLAKRWKRVSKKDSPKIWNYVGNLEDQRLFALSTVVRTVVEVQRSTAFGILDFDPSYKIPHFQ